MAESSRLLRRAGALWTARNCCACTRATMSASYRGALVSKWGPCGLRPCLDPAFRPNQRAYCTSIASLFIGYLPVARSGIRGRSAACERAYPAAPLAWVVAGGRLCADRPPAPTDAEGTSMSVGPRPAPGAQACCTPPARSGQMGIRATTSSHCMCTRSYGCLLPEAR